MLYLLLLISPAGFRVARCIAEFKQKNSLTPIFAGWHGYDAERTCRTAAASGLSFSFRAFLTF